MVKDTLFYQDIAVIRRLLTRMKAGAVVDEATELELHGMLSSVIRKSRNEDY